MFNASRTSTWVIVTIAASIVMFIAWSLWAELDQITRAPGRVVPIGRVQIVQSVDGGVISDIRVREGDKVKRGQLLVALDRVKLQAGVTEARAKVASLQSSMARIQAELYDRPLAFPAGLDGYPDFVRNQRELYFRRRAAQQSDLRSLHAMKTLMQQELDLNMPLLKTGDVARSEIIRMQRGVADLDGQISGKQAKYIADLQAEYTRTDEDLVSAQQVLTQREDSLKAADLVAPTDGIVKNVRLTTVGAVLRPGDEVLQIVPSGERLIVEAQVAPRDIAFVRVGQQASVKFDAYDSAIYGAGRGRVMYISPDTLVEQRADGQSVTYYRVNLEADASNLRPRHPGEKIEIQPGMTVTAEIITGKNTVFRYLTKPITRTTSESLRER